LQKQLLESARVGAHKSQTLKHSTPALSKSWSWSAVPQVRQRMNQAKCEKDAVPPAPPLLPANYPVLISALAGLAPRNKRRQVTTQSHRRQLE